MAVIDATFVNMMDATRTGRIMLSASDWTGTDREGLRIESNGSAAALGFYGGSAIVKPSGDIVAALGALGLVSSPTVSASLAIGTTAVAGSVATGGHLYVDSAGKLGMDALGFQWNPANHRVGLGGAPFNALLDIMHNPSLSTRAVQISNTTIQASDYTINSGSTTAAFGAQQTLAYFRTLTNDPIALSTNNRQHLYVTPAGPIWMGDAFNGTVFTPSGQLEIDAMSTTTVGLVIQGLASQTAPLFQLWGTTQAPAKHPQATVNAVWVVNAEASRTGRLTLAAEDWTGTSREGVRIESDATQALLSFFGVAAVARQTGGVATAAATYGSNEQGMIQRMYNALRAVGLLT
jgi:hypothetical protein